MAQRRRLAARRASEADDGGHARGAPGGVRKALGARRRAVLQDLHRPDDRPGSQRRGPQVLRREDSRRHRRSGARRSAHPGRSSDRHQANLHRHQLLSDVQPAQRRRWSACARRPSNRSTRRESPPPSALRHRRDGAGHRIRRDDRHAGQDRHRRPRRPALARRLGSTDRAPTSAWAPTASPICSWSRGRVRRRCWPTWCCTPKRM